METTPTPTECDAETRTKSGALHFLSGHKLHATLLAGALVLGGAGAAIASSPEPLWATSVSSAATAAPTESASQAPEAAETSAAQAPELVVAPAGDVAPAAEPAQAAEPAPAPAPEAPAPALEPAPEPAPAPVDNSLQNNAYTVVSGDTIGTIAARYGVDPAGMLSANGLGMYSTIVPGQVLKFTGPPIAVQAPAPAPAAVRAPAQASAPAAPAAPAQVQAPAPAPAPAPAGRFITLAGSGGQAAIDRCAGPIHFTPITESVSITEHDFCGGWARFSGIQLGEKVTISGYGTYTAYARGTVPQGGTMNNVRAVLGGTPPVFLQTCIPGTNQMLVIGLS